ncbi:MAG: glutathione peroxidase [Verrucomicrobiota bacterium]|nr:glutathione peroxidase [Verrucomicrobiota bacterium]
MLGFPCNPFGYQEPGGADSIRETCRIRYGVTFPVFVKIGVKGPEAQPLFRRLTKQLPGRIGRDIQRNFTQFLIGRDGMPLQRFASVTAPRKPDSAIRLVAGVDFPPEKAATLRRLLTELMDQLRESTAT